MMQTAQQEMTGTAQMYIKELEFTHCKYLDWICDLLLAAFLYSSFTQLAPQ
jgi:hypothetical protein